MKMRQLVRLMVSRTAAYAVGSIGGRAMCGVAVLACFSGVLWGMPHSAEELFFSPYLVIASLPVLVGSGDSWISGGAPCVELSKVYPALVTVQTYPGVYHAFDVPGETNMGIVG
jgi:hypothetical protein